MASAYTDKLLEMVEEGILDKDNVILACVKYMSEADVQDMMEGQFCLNNTQLGDTRMKWKTKNGWTIQKMKEALTTYNDGTRAMQDGDCSYRNSDGNRCAVGCFIPDDADDKIFASGGDAYDLLKLYPCLEDDMPLDTQALDRLQMVHDARPFSFSPVILGDIPQPTNDNLHERLFAWIDQHVENGSV